MCYGRTPRAAVQSQLREWQALGTTPQPILESLQSGIDIPFQSAPPPPFHLPNPSFTSKQAAFISEEIQDLLTTGAIVKCTHSNPPTCISPLGCLPKKKNKYRLIIDLRRLTERCVSPTFRYKDINTVLEVVSPKD